MKLWRSANTGSFLVLAAVLAIGWSSVGCGNSSNSVDEREARLAGQLKDRLGADSTQCRTIAWGDGKHFSCVARIEGQPYWLGVALVETRKQPVITNVDCSKPEGGRSSGASSICAVPRTLATAFR
jgi:hypothetical protein